MIRILTFCCLTPAAVWADAPRVITDFAPIHSLTAQVMGDLGAPDVLLPVGADPHDFALRPSDAAKLSAADLVIWTGPSLTPWLGDLIGNLAGNAVQMTLLDQSGWAALTVRDLADFGAAAKDHDHDHAHDHDHDDFDPHAWLDPNVAQIWLGAIADELSAIDPANAATYASNAATARARLAALDADLAAQLAPLAGRGYLLPHDGYQYFETRYGLAAAGAIAGIDARDPGPAQIASLRAQMADQDIVCVFSDAEIGASWAQLVTEGSPARTAEIDGVGFGLTSSAALYDALLRRLGDQFSACLAD
jgi:zinc transport system substrate-binding protein